MKDKGLVVGAIVFVVVVVIGLVFIAKPKAAKPAAAPAAASAKAVKVMPVPAKRALSKDMGGLTVKLMGANNKDLSVRIKAFKAVDSKSSVLMGTLASNRMQELVPGTYDIEVETMPAKIYKGINVQKGREVVEDLGRITGTLEIKAMTFTTKVAAYPVRVLHAKTNVSAAAGSANRPMEIVAGAYDIEIASLPRQTKKDVRIDAGKEVSIDADAVGALFIRIIEPTGKEVRGSVRVRKTENNELVTSTAANKPIDILPGSYTVECLSNPPQTKKDISVKAGEETRVEFAVQAPPAPAPRPVAPPKPAATVPAKKPGA